MSKLVPCKSCEHQVDKTAKVCPLCGVKSPGVKGSDVAKGCLSIIVLVIILTVILNSCTNDSDSSTKTSEPAQNPTAMGISTDLAQKYVVLNRQTYVTPRDKTGLKFVIYSEKADTFEKRGQTLIKAANDLLAENKLYEVVVRLSALPTIKPENINAGIAFYHPHKKDTWGNDKQYVWDVTASANRVENGQIEEDGKFYPLSYMTTQVFLEK